METLEWTAYTKMDQSHRLYGTRCNRMGRRTDFNLCRGKATYISTLGHVAVVHCDQCHSEAQEAP